MNSPEIPDRTPAWQPSYAAAAEELLIRTGIHRHELHEVVSRSGGWEKYIEKQLGTPVDIEAEAQLRLLRGTHTSGETMRLPMLGSVRRNALVTAALDAVLPRPGQIQKYPLEPYEDAAAKDLLTVTSAILTHGSVIISADGRPMQVNKEALRACFDGTTLPILRTKYDGQKRWAVRLSSAEFSPIGDISGLLPDVKDAMVIVTDPQGTDAIRRIVGSSQTIGELDLARQMQYVIRDRVEEWKKTLNGIAVNRIKDTHAFVYDINKEIRRRAFLLAQKAVHAGPVTVLLENRNERRPNTIAFTLSKEGREGIALEWAVGRGQGKSPMAIEAWTSLDLNGDVAASAIRGQLSRGDHAYIRAMATFFWESFTVVDAHDVTTWGRQQAQNRVAELWARLRGEQTFASFCLALQQIHPTGDVRFLADTKAGRLAITDMEPADATVVPLC